MVKMQAYPKVLRNIATSLELAENLNARDELGQTNMVDDILFCGMREVVFRDAYQRMIIYRRVGYKTWRLMRVQKR